MLLGPCHGYFVPLLYKNSLDIDNWDNVTRAVKIHRCLSKRGTQLKMFVGGSSLFPQNVHSDNKTGYLGQSCFVLIFTHKQLSLVLSSVLLAATKGPFI